MIGIHRDRAVSEAGQISQVRRLNRASQGLLRAEGVGRKTCASHDQERDECDDWCSECFHSSLLGIVSGHGDDGEGDNHAAKEPDDQAQDHFGGPPLFGTV